MRINKLIEILFIGILFITVRDAVFDTMAAKRLGTYELRSVIFHSGGYAFLILLCGLVFYYTKTKVIKRVIIALSLLFIARLYLNLVCLRCDTDEYYHYFLNVRFDYITWSILSISFTIAIWTILNRRLFGSS